MKFYCSSKRKLLTKHDLKSTLDTLDDDEKKVLEIFISSFLRNLDRRAIYFFNFFKGALLTKCSGNPDLDIFTVIITSFSEEAIITFTFCCFLKPLKFNHNQK